MYIKTDENGLILESRNIAFDGATEVDDEVELGYDGKARLASQMRTDEYLAQKRLYELRRQRERECFPVINRGQLWYSRLTDAQKAELDAWYNAWLDVTETLIVPDKPQWLEEK